MKKLILEIDNAVYHKITAFLELIPGSKLRRIETYEDTNTGFRGNTKLLDYLEDNEADRPESVPSKKENYQWNSQDTIDLGLE